MVRLRRVRLEHPGWTRRRAGRGFVYLDVDRRRIAELEHLERIRALAIPPAWRDVWICPWPNGHIQAAGIDDAARRQYLYHQQWHARRARLKHEHVLEVARRLPAARRRVRADLALEGMPRDKALALTFRLLDRACLRVGTEGYTRRHGSFGLATLRREHVHVLPDEDGRPGAVHLRFPAKSGQVRDTVVDDEVVADLVRTLLRRRDESPELLAWRDDDGWHDVTSADVGRYVRDRLGEATPKDFRTWHATVLAARGLAAAGPPAGERAGTPARRGRRRQGRLRGARQHPDRRARVVHRPACHRPVGARGDDRAGPLAAGRREAHAGAPHLLTPTGTPLTGRGLEPVPRFRSRVRAGRRGRRLPG